MINARQPFGPQNQLPKSVICWTYAYPPPTSSTMNVYTDGSMPAQWANLHMGEVESKDLNSIKVTTPSQWFKYGDNTWLKIKIQEVQAFTEHLNSVDSNIKFTREDVKGTGCLSWTLTRM